MKRENEYKFVRNLLYWFGLFVSFFAVLGLLVMCNSNKHINKGYGKSKNKHIKIKSK